MFQMLAGVTEKELKGSVMADSRSYLEKFIEQCARDTDRAALEGREHHSRLYAINLVKAMREQREQENYKRPKLVPNLPTTGKLF